MQKEIRTSLSSLYYELSSPVYQGEIAKDVYLNFIDYSNMDYYTTVKKKGTVVIPLLLFNYSKQTYRVSLGEGSLEQNYREFLTDALLTECNSSTCFNLIDNQQEIANDSAFSLSVKILHNKTRSKIKLRESTYIWFTALFDPEEVYAEYENDKVEPATTELKLLVQLKKGKEQLFEKEYQVNRSCNFAGSGYGSSVAANDACIHNMGTSLSLATKEIVEEISKELHLLLFNI